MTAGILPSAPLTIAAALHAELGKLEQFVALLNQEQDYLQQADVDALLPLVDTKNTLVAELSQLSAQRETALLHAGIEPGRAGMNTWLARPGHASHAEAWQKLLALAGEARSLNILNGKLIGLHLQKNQQAFTALMSATNRAVTYGPDGQQHSGLGGRFLGSA